MVEIKNNEILVSVLIPTYGQENFIEQAIRSVLLQTYKQLEIIICDDCSPDKTEERVKPFLVDSRVKYCRNSKNVGRVANYRIGLYERATGDWVINLDGDDYFTDNFFIQNAVLAAQSDKDVVIVQAGEFIKSANDVKEKLPKIKSELETITGQSYLLNFYKDYHFSHLGTMYNRDKAIEVGFYDHDILSADIESILKLSFSGNVILMKKCVGVWSIHDKNISHNADLDVNLTNLTFIDRCYNFGKSKIDPGLLKNWKKEMYNFFFSTIVIHEMEKRRGIKKIGGLLILFGKRPTLMLRWYILKTIFKKFKKR